MKEWSHSQSSDQVFTGFCIEGIVLNTLAEAKISKLVPIAIQPEKEVIVIIGQDGGKKISALLR